MYMGCLQGKEGKVLERKISGTRAVAMGRRERKVLEKSGNRWAGLICQFKLAVMAEKGGKTGRQVIQRDAILTVPEEREQFASALPSLSIG